MSLHRRLHAEQRGFTLVETLIAITLIFGSLVFLAYSAMIGFTYQRLARERQAANGIANRIAEEVRGLAYSKVQSGLLTSGLPADPNLVTSCAGDAVGTFRLTNCSGEKVVSSTGLPTTVPLVPNHGSFGKAQGYPTTFTWRTYVTNNDPTSSPYRVTVMVSWSSANAPTSSTQIKTQSFFFSPSGCVSSSTHPFAAPCQPYFYGTAVSPPGSISISGTVQGINFQEGKIATMGVQANGQQEQVGQVQASFTKNTASVTDDEGTRTSGGLPTVTTAADTDPGGTVPTYSTASLTSGTDPGGTVTSPATPGPTYFEFIDPENDTGRADSATKAGGGASCPPAPQVQAAVETDFLPCAGAYALRTDSGDRSYAILHPDGLTPDLGDIQIARISTPNSNFPFTAYVNRVAVSGQDGRLEETVNRRFANVQIGRLPAAIEPAGWNQNFITLTQYRDTVSAAVGTSAPAAAGAIANPATATVTYWNGTASYDYVRRKRCAPHNLQHSCDDRRRAHGDRHVLHDRPKRSCPNT